MRYRPMKVLGFFLICLVFTASASASPGQRYDVRKDGTKVYQAPRADAPVVTRLNKGDRVIEWRRQGAWVNVSQMGTVGKDGWVRISRLRTEASEIGINMSPRGHFQVQATVNGRAIDFLVDTGATQVVLRPEDAQKLGLNLSELNFSQRARTPGGIIRVAPIILDEIRIGQLTIRNVSAGVNQKSGGIRSSLLGMSFLNRLRGYEVRGKRLVLRW